jgi:hypothetical protein
MSYYHVTIQTKNSENWICIFKDLSEADLKKNFLKPYKLGNSIYSNGNILSPTEIIQIIINKTDNKHEDELKAVQDESYREVVDYNRRNPHTLLVSAGRGHNDYEINECGDNVTDKFISSGPGHGTPLTIFSEFIKHPWVVRIVGGLILIAVTALLGFN